MSLKYVFTGLFLLFLVNAYSQGPSCAESDPFCTGTIYEFPAGTSGAAEPGPYYGCLSTQPAPAWYHMRIGNPGPITIYMHSVPQRDIDFACWGPFTDPTSPCPYGLTSATMVDCSYSTSWQEWCDIPNGLTGQYYILLITNFSQQPCNIIFSQTAGSGSTDCSILPPLVNSDSPLCVGETLHLTAETIANATYAWTGPNGFTSTEQNPVIPDVTLAHAGDYSCVITVFSQSSPPAVVTVVINELPDASLLNSNMTTCPGGQAFMIVQLTGAGPFEVIYYDGSAFFTAPGLTGPVDTIYVSPPGTETYTLTQVSDVNCTKTLSGLVFQVYNYPPTTGFMSGGGTICEGDTADLVFNLTGSPPWTITYLTNGSNPQTVMADVTPFIILVTPIVTTQYQFSQLSDAYCTGTVSGQAVVTVDFPSGVLSGDNTICAGATAYLIFNLYGFPPWTFTYTANGSNDQTVIAGFSPYSVEVSPSISTLYEMTSLLDVFCTGTAGGQAMITIHQPTGELSGISTICAGESAGIIFTLTGDPPWTITYTENGGNPQTETVYTSPYAETVSPGVSTTYEFTYLEDDSCPGIPAGQANVTVNPMPAVSAGPDKTIPNGTSTTLEGSVSGGSGDYGYQWEPADKLVNAQVVQPLTLNLNASTLFTLTGTDNNGGCFALDEMLVTITGGVLSCSSTANPMVICQGETSQLQAIPSGGSGNYTFQWSSNPPGFSSDIQNPVVSPVMSTNYTVTVNDGYNVVQSGISITVNQLPLPDAGPDQVIIFGTTTDLQGSASAGSGSYQYHWEPAYKLNDPDIPGPATVNLYETTLFTLTVTDILTGCVCGQADAVAVIISGDALSVNPSVQNSIICSGDSTQLFALAGGGTGIYTYAWTSDPAGFVSSEPDPVVHPVESTIYTINISDGFNSAIGSTGVTVNPKPVVYLGSDTTVCVFDTITIDAGNEGASYLWSNGSIAETISVGSTGIGFESKIVTVTVTSAEGCISAGQRTITFDFIACSGIAAPFQESGLRIYPNPGKGLIYFQNSNEDKSYQLTVIDAFGRLIIKNEKINFSGSGNQFVLDLKTQPEGIYLIRLESPPQSAVSFKYILTK